MNISLIGGGNVGGTLCRRFIEAGHSVKLGVRNPSDDKYAGLPTSTVDEAAAFGEVVLVCTPWRETESALKAIAPLLKGKIVVDCTNPIRQDFTGMEIGHDDSGGQHVAGWLPESHVVKGFNTIGFGVMANPQFGDRAAALLIAGDHADAKQTVAKLAKDIGFDPVDIGPMSRASLSEAAAWTWITLSLNIGREFAFSLVRR